MRRLHFIFPRSQTTDSGMIFPFYLGSEWRIDIKLYSNHAKLHEKPVTGTLHWEADAS